MKFMAFGTISNYVRHNWKHIGYNGIMSQLGILRNERTYMTNGIMKWNVRNVRDDRSLTRGYYCDDWNFDGVILLLDIREETCDWHSRGGSSTYDIMHYGGYVTRPIMMGNRRNGIGFVSRPATILFPLSRLHLPCDLAYWHYVVHLIRDVLIAMWLGTNWNLLDPSHATWLALDTVRILAMWLGMRMVQRWHLPVTGKDMEIKWSNNFVMDMKSYNYTTIRLCDLILE